MHDERSDACAFEPECRFELQGERLRREAKHCRGGAGSALYQSRTTPLERTVETERNVAARLVLQIIAGVAARQRDLRDC